MIKIELFIGAIKTILKLISISFWKEALLNPNFEWFFFVKLIMTGVTADILRILTLSSERLKEDLK